VLLVVGGHTRNIGKTSVVAGLIRALPEANWTAVKITQFGHGVCAAEGGNCDCATGLDHPYAISEEYEPNDTDSGRFLAAGAKRAFWLRTAVGQLATVVPSLRKIVSAAENTIVESNSLLDFFEPDLFLMVLDFSKEDFKESSLRVLTRADALIVINPGRIEPPWRDVPHSLLNAKTQFGVEPPYYVTAAISKFVRSRLTPVTVSPSSR